MIRQPHTTRRAGLPGLCLAIAFSGCALDTKPLDHGLDLINVDAGVMGWENAGGGLPGSGTGGATGGVPWEATGGIGSGGVGGTGGLPLGGGGVMAGGTARAYARCLAPTDCGASLECVDPTLGVAAAFGFNASQCSAGCALPGDCPPPTEGTAVASCELTVCVLDCQAGAVCPTGLSCAQFFAAGQLYNLCL